MKITQTHVAGATAATAITGSATYAIVAAATSGNEVTNETIYPDDDKKEEPKVEPKKPENLEPKTSTFSTDEIRNNYAGELLVSKVRKANLSKLPLPKDEKNQSWWKWAYENKYLKLTIQENSVKLDNVFSNLDKAYGHEESDKSLSKACENAYRKEKDDFFKYGNSDYLVKNIGEFCTKGEKPLDVSEPEATVYTTTHTQPPYGNGVLRTSKNKNKFVKNEPENDLWWKWSHTKFFSQKGLNDHFSGVTSAYNKSSIKTNEKYTTLNHACDAAYKKEPKELTSLNLLENIKRFCSIGATKEDIAFPDWKEPENPKVLSVPDATSFITGVASIKSNKEHLIDPDQSKGKPEWWEWAYLDRYKPEVAKSRLPDPFKKIEFGYSSVEDNYERALNQACKVAYKSDNDSLEKGEGNYQLLSVIKRFCTTTKYLYDVKSLEKPTTE